MTDEEFTDTYEDAKLDWAEKRAGKEPQVVCVWGGCEYHISLAFAEGRLISLQQAISDAEKMK
jgi:hypothetical protein